MPNDGGCRAAEDCSTHDSPEGKAGRVSLYPDAAVVICQVIEHVCVEGDRPWRTVPPEGECAIHRSQRTGCPAHRHKAVTNVEQGTVSRRIDDNRKNGSRI